jgi:hypothetical protein
MSVLGEHSDNDCELRLNACPHIVGFRLSPR